MFSFGNRCTITIVVEYGQEPVLDRRDFIAALASVTACGFSARPSFADTLMAIPADVTPPAETREKFVAWMQDKRKEDPKFLAQRWDRLQELIAKKDVWDAKNIRGFC